MNWDASFHEHIGLRLAERRPGGVTIVATNQAEATGRVRLFIGCAKDLRVRRSRSRPWAPCRPGRSERRAVTSTPLVRVLQAAGGACGRRYGR